MHRTHALAHLTGHTGSLGVFLSPGPCPWSGCQSGVCSPFHPCLSYTQISLGKCMELFKNFLPSCKQIVSHHRTGPQRVSHLTEGPGDSPRQCVEAHLDLLNGYLAFTAWLGHSLLSQLPTGETWVISTFLTEQRRSEPPLDVLPAAFHDK